VSDKSTVFNLVALFRETGSVSDRKYSGRPTVLNDVTVENFRHFPVQYPREF
jgi:hypothetical protein